MFMIYIVVNNQTSKNMYIPYDPALPLLCLPYRYMNKCALESIDEYYSGIVCKSQNIGNRLSYQKGKFK